MAEKKMAPATKPAPAKKTAAPAAAKKKTAAPAAEPAKKTAAPAAAKKTAAPAAAKKTAAPAAAKKTAAPAAAKKTAAPAAAKKTAAPAAAAPKKAAAKAGGAAKAASSGGPGTRENPWALETPPGTSKFEAFRDETLDPPALVVRVGKTELRYHLRCIQDLRAMLVARGDWVPLGGADEQKPAAEGTVEAWGRAAKNPVGGWYGIKKGLRGRFGVYVPPVLEALGLAEVEHGPKNNRMRSRK